MLSMIAAMAGMHKLPPAIVDREELAPFDKGIDGCCGQLDVSGPDLGLREGNPVLLVSVATKSPPG